MFFVEGFQPFQNYKPGSPRTGVFLPVREMLPMGEPLALLNVIAPAGVKSGQMFAVVAPSGETLSVPMPEDVGPGQMFTCIVPAHVLQPPTQITITHVTQITQNIYLMPAVKADPGLQHSDTVAKLPTPLEMQRIGDQQRHQEELANERLPPMNPCWCTCIGDFSPTDGGARWELPPVLRSCGCITVNKMDLRNQTFSPVTRQMSIEPCACIHTNDLLVPPEVLVSPGCWCGGCIGTLEVKDRRPQELRGSRPKIKGVVRSTGCACINATNVTVLEHGQRLPKNFLQWVFGAPSATGD